jgi:hypothetical protein
MCNANKLTNITHICGDQKPLKNGLPAGVSGGGETEKPNE